MKCSSKLTIAAVAAGVLLGSFALEGYAQGQGKGGGGDPGRSSDLEQRVTALEQKVVALEDRIRGGALAPVGERKAWKSVQMDVWIKDSSGKDGPVFYEVYVNGALVGRFSGTTLSRDLDPFLSAGRVNVIHVKLEKYTEEKLGTITSRSEVKISGSDDGRSWHGLFKWTASPENLTATFEVPVASR